MSLDASLFDRFADQHVLVIGDMVADQYLVGRPARISREAPVLILEYTSTFLRPGGAANVAYNLAALGARTSVAGVVGKDDLGRQVRAVLEDAGIDTAGLIADPDRPTSLKTRVLAKGTQEVQQQVVRIDRVDDSPIGAEVERQLVEATCGSIERGAALLISDYESGAISPEIIETCLPFALEHGAVVTVDSHGDLFRFRGVAAATPNQPEVESSVGRPLRTDEDLDRAARDLLTGMEAGAILVTRGSEGIALYEPGREPLRIPAVHSETQVIDPTGAGDTVAAVFTLAIASGCAMGDAAALANVAGGIVVRHLGTATVSREQLWEASRNAGLVSDR